MPNHESHHPNKPSLIMQWIVSLAVSVVSCSILFVIFAAHLVQVQSKVTIDGVRLDAALQRQSQLIMEVSDIRRAILTPNALKIASHETATTSGEAPSAQTETGTSAAQPATAPEASAPAPAPTSVPAQQQDERSQSSRGGEFSSSTFAPFAPSLAPDAAGTARKK